MTWVDSLPAVQRTAIDNVFNGSFESEPSQLGFDWRIRRLNGAMITRSPDRGASGKVALRIEFANQRVQFQHVRQLLALAPGHYRFTGQSRMEQLESDRGLIWGIQCVGRRKAIMESEPFRGDYGWRSFQQEFVLPPGACDGQWLTLAIPARAPSERQVSGVAWFDRIGIERTGE